MNVKYMSLSLIVLHMLAATALAQVRYMVFVPASPDSATAKAAWESAVHVLDHAAPGAEIEFYNGLTQERIAGCRKPPGDKVRAGRAMAPHVAPFRSHLRAALAGETRIDNRLHIPAITRTVEAAIGPDKEHVRILLFGSMLHSDEHDPSATFTVGQVPNDSAIGEVSDNVVYGTADRRGSLKRVYVDFGTSDRGVGMRELQAVGRFWAHYLGRMDVSLTSFRPASVEIGENAIRGLTDPIPHSPLDTEAGPPAIISVPGSEIEPGEPRPLTGNHQTDGALQSVASEIPRPSNGRINIAAVWTMPNGSADVDLWVRPRRGAPELNFGNTSTPHGKYLRDVMNARSDRGDTDWRSAWEAVELDDTPLDAVEIWLNLYSSTGGEVHGIVRVQTEDGLVDIPFRFGCAGSKAAGSNRRSGHPAWRRIDLATRLSE